MVSLALAVSPGCTGGTAQSEVVLRMTSWQTPPEMALDEPTVRGFERSHPGVRVVHEPITNQAEYREKVITSVMAGAPPDVLLLDGIDFAAFREAGVLLDLAPFASRVGIDLGAFYPSVLAMFTHDGRVFAFPKGFSPIVVYFNRALFDSAAVPYPRDEWTWDEFLRTARALTRDVDGDGVTDQWGTVLLRPFYAWQAWLWSGGADILAPDGSRATGHLDDARSDSAIAFLTGLVSRHRVAPRPNALRAVTGTETRLFYSGRLALMTSGHWLIPNIRAQLARGRLKLGVVSVPRRADASTRTVLFASGWAVPRNTRHRRLAVELAAALSGADAQRRRIAAGLELSTIPAVQAAYAAADSLGLEAAFLRQVAFGAPPWGARVARFREVEDRLPEIIDRVLINAEPIDAVTADVARRIDRILAR